MKDCCRPEARGGRAWSTSGAGDPPPPGPVGRLRAVLVLAAALAVVRFGVQGHAAGVAVEVLYFVPVLLAAPLGLSPTLFVLFLQSAAVTAQATWNSPPPGSLVDQGGFAASLWIAGLLAADGMRRLRAGPGAPQAETKAGTD